MREAKTRITVRRSSLRSYGTQFRLIDVALKPLSHKRSFGNHTSNMDHKPSPREPDQPSLLSLQISAWRSQAARRIVPASPSSRSSAISRQKLLSVIDQALKILDADDDDDDDDDDSMFSSNQEQDNFSIRQ